MTALVERVTVPLVPRTAAGCCDLATAFYGRHLPEALRLYAAVAGPAVAVVYGLGRFAGTDLTAAAVAVLLASKPLGLLTVAASSRAVFGEPFERPAAGPPRTGAGRLRALARGSVTAAAVVAAAVLAAATFDDAWGAGRLAALGLGPAALAVVLIGSLLAARAVWFLAERHSPGSAVRNGLLLGLMLRVVVAAPVALLFFKETRTAGIVVAAVWLPVGLAVLTWRSFGGERRALRDLDPTLHGREARGSDGTGVDLAQSGIVVGANAAGLAVVTLVGLDTAAAAVGLAGPLFGTVSDYFGDDLFEPGLALSAIYRSPTLAACATAAGLFAYQLGRIAWFFAYLDARIRRDCWDMELLLAREAKRLEGG